MSRDPVGGVLRNLLDLQRLGNGVSLEVRAIIEALFDEIAGEVARIDPTGTERERNRTLRLERLLGNVDGLVGQGFQEVRKTLTRRLAEIGVQQATWAAQQLGQAIGSAAVDIKSGRVGLGLMRSIIQNDPFEGAPLKAWVDGLEGSLTDRDLGAVRRQLQIGMAGNETLDQLVRRIRGRSDGRGGFTGGVLQTTTRQAEAIARTGVNFIAVRGQNEVYRANADILTGLEFTATLDRRTTEICMALDGEILDAKEPDPNKVPPRHWRCLPGDALVLSRSRITGVSKRWFDGDVVVVRTASGRELTCTPNHPVLTPQGWVAAHLLHVGGYVVSDGGREWPGLCDGNDQHGPARIEDVARAAFRSCEMVTGPVPVATEDFHGDGLEGQVAVVASERLLRNDRADAALAEHPGEGSLALAHANLASLPREGGSFERGVARTAPARGGVGGAGELPPLLRRHAGHSGELLLATITERDAPQPQQALDHSGGAAIALGDAAGPRTRLVEGDNLVARKMDASVVAQLDAGELKVALDHLVRDPEATGDGRHRLAGQVPPDEFVHVEAVGVPSNADPVRLQSVGDGLDADADLARQIISGATGPVFLDEILHVEVQRFADHVYNLETEGGFYAAQGIITHNCRSVLVPTVDWAGLGIEPPAEGKRASADGPVPSSVKYEDWLRGQPAHVQNEILGPTRADLFRRGKLSLRDLITTDQQVLTIPELRARPSDAPKRQPVTPRKLAAAIGREERMIADLDIEHAAAFNPDTAEVVFRKSSGAADFVAFTKEEAAQFRDMIFTHNHPGSSSFSPEDVGFSITNDVAEMRATSRLFNYRLTRPEGGWENVDEVNARFRPAFERALERLRRRVDSGEMSAQDAGRELFHEVWREVFRGTATRYIRRRR